MLAVGFGFINATYGELEKGFHLTMENTEKQINKICCKHATFYINHNLHPLTRPTASLFTQLGMKMMMMISAEVFRDTTTNLNIHISNFSLFLIYIESRNGTTLLKCCS